jgi:hypothetical protein
VPVRPYFDHHPDFNDYDALMRIDLAILEECDAIAMLPDWRESPGARQELAQAKALKKARVAVDWEGRGLYRQSIEDLFVKGGQDVKGNSGV